jgi:uncharacterized protein YjbJ (UPF0337 family)
MGTVTAPVGAVAARRGTRHGWRHRNNSGARDHRAGRHVPTTTLTRRYASIASLITEARIAGKASITSILKMIRHGAQTAKGKAKRSTGRVTGNRRLRTKGRTEKAVGDVKQAADEVKDAFKH